jgi:hypothetical protein
MSEVGLVLQYKSCSILKARETTDKLSESFSPGLVRQEVP